MGRVFLLFVLVAMVSVIGACDPVQQPPNQKRNEDSSTMSAELNKEEGGVDFTASFEIETYGVKRSFSRGMYLKLSKDVYIESPESSHIIHIKKEGVTWNDFFKTLPMNLTKDCLITGTKEELCNSETRKLKFFINELENPDALDQVIKADDRLQVVYGE